MNKRTVMIRSKVKRATFSSVSHELMSRIRRRVAKRKSIGATMTGIAAIARDVDRQRVCSEWVGNLKFHPIQCSPPKMTPKRANTTIRDQRSLRVVGA